MDKTPLTLADFSFKKNEVDHDKLLVSQSEDDFMSLAVELFKEVIQITAILGCMYSHDEQLKSKNLTRNEAILSGLLIRLMKLQIGILDNVCQRRSEIVAILYRCLSETVVNIIYLIKSNSNSLYDEYVDYSLREEKKLLKLIDNNIKSRGYELHIERRMRNSILGAFKKSDLDVEKIDEKNSKPWGKSIYNRAETIGMAEAYRGLFGGPSHAIHGNWQDLLRFHLIKEGSDFLPSADWTMPRPQTVFSVAMLSSEACRVYSDSFLPECRDKQRIVDLIKDCYERISLADELHERFLERDTKGN
jgi:hypothetical protein